MREVVRGQALQLGLVLAADDALPSLQDVDTVQVCIPFLYPSIRCVTEMWL